MHDDFVVTVFWLLILVLIMCLGFDTLIVGCEVVVRLPVEFKAFKCL